VISLFRLILLASSLQFPADSGIQRLTNWH